jgi:glycosyltransferase involved in cell wall biosynthesis
MHKQNLGKTVFYGLPDEAQHLFNGNDLVASHVGRFCPMKGQLEVLMALNNLNKKGLKLSIIFIGPFEESRVAQDYITQCYKFIEEHELGDQVTFLGHQKDSLHIVKMTDLSLHTACNGQVIL